MGVYADRYARRVGVAAAPIARLLGASPPVVTSIAPKSLTAAVAMGLNAPLTAVVVPRLL
jgi:putative effector of murein hydrolase